MKNIYKIIIIIVFFLSSFSVTLAAESITMNVSTETITKDSATIIVQTTISGVTSPSMPEVLISITDDKGTKESLGSIIPLLTSEKGNTYKSETRKSGLKPNTKYTITASAKHNNITATTFTNPTAATFTTLSEGNNIKEEWFYLTNANLLSGGFTDKSTCVEASNMAKVTSPCFLSGSTEYATAAAKQNAMLNKNKPADDSTYHLLAPIPGMKEDFVDGSQQIGGYINSMFNIFLGLCAALAVIMIIIYGVTWMGTDSVFGKTEAKSKIGGAIGGLLLALGAWVILNTINPDLLGGAINIKQASIELEGDAESPVNINRGDATKIGLTCDHAGGKNDIPSTAKSFSGKMTYSQDLPKGQVVNNKIKLDCSGYINYVLQCVGINTSDLGINSGTSTIFSGAEKVDSTKTYPTSINGVELNVGDLVGWRAGDNTGKYAKSGHVMIYIGGGLVADSHSGSSDAFGSFSLTKYKDQIKFIKRL